MVLWVLRLFFGLLAASANNNWNFFFPFSDKAYFVDLFVRASNTPAIKMYEKVMVLLFPFFLLEYF